MVDDLQQKLKDSDASVNRFDKLNSRWIYLNEIRFHNDILEWVVVQSDFFLLIFLALHEIMIIRRNVYKLSYLTVWKCIFIQFDSISHCFRLANRTSRIMSAFLFYQLLFSAMSTGLFLVAIDFDHLLTVATICSIEGVLCLLASTFIFCSMSEHLTSTLLSIGDIFYERAWYRMSVKHQQIIILAIHRSQMKFRLMGLGMIECSLSVYTSVLNFNLLT